MAASFGDLTGRRFNRLVVLSKQGRCWLCECDCGRKTRPSAGSLVHGKTKSCGCLRKEIMREKATKHGMHSAPEYSVWVGMNERCRNDKNKSYCDYGARGIRVCDRWLDSFENFYADMGPRPTPKHTIDRIDVNGPYAPSNCRWVTRTVQASNTRRNRKIEWCGISRTIAEWSRATGLGQKQLRQALRPGETLGKVMNRAFSTPRKFHDQQVFEFNGESLTISGWSAKLGIKMPTMWKRLRRYGWTIERCVAEARTV